MDCFELPIISQNLNIDAFMQQGDNIDVFIKICCKQCNLPLNRVGVRQLICQECNKSICMICKNEYHPDPCNFIKGNYNFYCRCRMLRKKNTPGIFINCPLCKHICIVCYKAPENSHKNCASLFISPSRN